MGIWWVNLKEQQESLILLSISSTSIVHHYIFSSLWDMRLVSFSIDVAALMFLILEVLVHFSKGWELRAIFDTFVCIMFSGSIVTISVPEKLL